MKNEDKAIDKYLYILNMFKVNDQIISFKKIYFVLSEKFTCTELGCRCTLLNLQYYKLLEKVQTDAFKRTKTKIPKNWIKS